MFNIKEVPAQIKQEIDKYQFFQWYRIIDPDLNEVYDYVDDKVVSKGWKCYEIWGRTEPCTNCTSEKAILTGRRVTKLEYMEEHVTLICSLPIEINGAAYVLELADDVTDSFVVNTPIQEDNQDVGNLIHTLNDMMTKDLFTGLFNKNYILEEIWRLIEQEQSFSAVLIDLDHFKTVNDTYGHMVGDKVLITIADYIKAMAKDTAICGGRFGGDEFFLILKKKDQDESRLLCRTLAEQLLSHEFGDKCRNLEIRISYGIGEWKPGESMEAFLNRIDQEMYRMKKQK